MITGLNRREFVQLTLGGSMLCAAGAAASDAAAPGRGLVSPGCRRSKVKLGRLYIGVPKAHYPNPAIDVVSERQNYDTRFAELKDALADVDFVVDELIGTSQQLQSLADKLEACDGILVVHLTLHTMPVMKAVLELGKPTVIFAAPYAGHEWYQLSDIRRQKLGENMECVLSTDYRQLAGAIRPFRAMHHLREAKVLNLAASMPGDEVQKFAQRFGTEFKLVGLERVLALYEAVDERAARDEADRWTKNVIAIVEPSAEEIYKSCRLALALEKLLEEENATVMTVDCYGSMWRKIPAYPCVAFTRLNDMGLGGICQSDLPCAMMHILYQGLTGRPGFVCNPTFDFATNSATLIHCLGPTRMDGPAGPAAPYKLRSIMEREEGATPQVRMRTDQDVTAAILDENSSTLRYFTGRIVAVPETERGCRTQITVKLDGDAETLWRNWTAGIHRVSCYGNLTKELAAFARFAKLRLVNEAV